MKKKRTIFIELTSLLDVILIMIFVLLMQAKSQTAQAMDRAEQEQQAAFEISRQMEALRESAADLEAEARDLNRSVSELKEEAAGLKRRLDSRELVLENSLLLTISTGEDGLIRLEQEDQPAALIPYDWADDTYAGNRLRSLLHQTLDQVEGRALFVVFQYDRNRIYIAEYDMIFHIISEIKSEAEKRNILCSYIEMDIQE